MSTLPPFSKRKAALIASGELKINGTFKRKSMAEIIAAQAEMKGMVINEVFGPKKQQTSAADIRRRAKEKAWKWFSLFIRLRDSGPDGYGKCCTCQRNAHWSTMDAGHWITRAKEATLFDERQVHLQCKGCNRFQGGKPLEHERHIIRKYGPAAPEEIKTKAVQECRRTLSDYQFIADTYKSRVERIKQMEPSKFKTTNP